MLRTIQVCERSAQVDASRIVDVPAATPTIIFPDETQTKGEIITRYLQHQAISGKTSRTGYGTETTKILYISFGILGPNGEPICDKWDMYHVTIQPYQLFDCFPHRQVVCVYCDEDTTVSTVRIVRNDMGH